MALPILDFGLLVSGTIVLSHSVYSNALGHLQETGTGGLDRIERSELDLRTLYTIVSYKGGDIAGKKILCAKHGVKAMWAT